MNSRYIRTMLIYTLFQLGIFFKTLNKIYYLDLNQKCIEAVLDVIVW